MKVLSEDVRGSPLPGRIQRLRQTAPHSQAAQIRERTDFVPKVTIVLGSGLNSLADGMERAAVVPYQGIKGLPVSCVTVPPADATNIVLNEEVVNSLADAMTDDLGKLLTLFIEKLKDR